MTKRDNASAAPGNEFDEFEEWEDAGDEAGDAGKAKDEVDGADDAGADAPDEFGAPDDFDLPAEEPPAEAVPPRPAAARMSAPAPRAPVPPNVPKQAAPQTPPPKFDAAALDLAPDVPVQVIAVIGKRGVTLKELMELRQGQVIDLKRPPNETVDIVVNGKLFARGELVEIEGKMGVRIIKLAR